MHSEEPARLSEEPPPGWWSDFGPPASVDWCEPNYAYSMYVAEWWNTVSSFVIAGAALAALFGLRRASMEGRFRLALVTVALVGLGSVAFHGTLLKLAQAADELPMIYVGLVLVYTLRFRAEPHPAPGAPYWKLGLLIYAIGFTVAYFTLTEYFVLFILSYAAVVAFVAVRSVYLSFVADPNPVRQRLVTWAAGAYVGGVLALWLPERFLGCEHPAQSLQLHALFHLTSAVGSVSWVIWAWRDRQLLGPVTR